MDRRSPGTSAYPPAPWGLRGTAVQTLHFVDTELARRFVPAGLAVVPVLPGKTLGGLYLASYGAGSVLEYHELIVVAAVVRAGRHLGAWVSHIFVDDLRSIAGGREIWGLPKELAQFRWETSTRPHSPPDGVVEVSQGGHLLCRLDYRASRWGRRRVPVRLPLPVVSRRGPETLAFCGAARARLTLVHAAIDVPPESPIAPLGLCSGRSRLALHYGEFRLTTPAPRVIGRYAREGLVAHAASL